ncbi:INO80 complex subunit B-like conserved region [Trinorchestia longiramus]|nr:INO80 complex subunit B-like conserved region [Trinorchestia longiramus]
MEEDFHGMCEDLSGTSSSLDVPPGGEASSKRSKKRKHKHSKDKLQKKDKNILPSTAASEGIQGAIWPPTSAGLYPVTGDSASVDHAGTEHPRSKKSKKKDKNKDKTSTRVSKKEKKILKRSLDAEEFGALKAEVAAIRSEKKKSGRDDDDTDSEEERWLTAIEAGKLDEVDDELKRFRNPRLLTARQRALLGKQRTADGDEVVLPADLPPSDAVAAAAPHEALLRLQDIPPEPLLALPSGFKEKVVTQEMLEKRAIKSERRKAQALVKREEDKRKTVDRLLKKQDPKLLRTVFTKKATKTEVAMFSYRSNSAGVFISLPSHCPYPLEAAAARPKPVVEHCGVEGCTNIKSYRCSKTGVPLCSLRCYKANLSSGPVVVAS